MLSTDLAQNNETRAQLRSQLRVKRKQLSTLQKQSNASALAECLMNTSAFKAAKNIAVYLSNDSEIDLQALIYLIWESHKNCYLPVLDKKKLGHLIFLPYIKSQPLVTNKFNIAEPKYDVKQIIDARELDIIFMPLVGFDKHLNRLGMGGGFYDRSLAFLAQADSNSLPDSKPRLIGLAHSIQEVDEIPTEAWDVKLNQMFTEKGGYPY